MYIHLTKLCHDKIVSLAQLLWGDIALIDEQYLVYHQQTPENQTIRFEKNNANHLSLLINLFF
jgi:hypothetical protein